MTDVEKYGVRKFHIRSMPNSRPVPIAMSEYPEKSPYTCKVNASVASAIDGPVETSGFA